MSNKHKVVQLSAKEGNEIKAELRKQVLQARNSLTKAEINKKSLVICDKLKEIEGFTQADTIMAYLPFRNEVDITSLFNALWSGSKRIVIPVCDPVSIKLIPSLLLDITHDLTPGTWGILEPKPEAMRPVDPTEIDFVIVPGVAFDPAGNRLGYGGGYYDRFLPRLKMGTPKVAVAFQLQILDALVPGEFDVPMDMVITEEQAYYRKIGEED